MALGLLRPPLPPFEPAKNPGPVRHLSSGGSRLGRYGVAAQPLKGASPHSLWLDHDQRVGSRQWPT